MRRLAEVKSEGEKKEKFKLYKEGRCFVVEQDEEQDVCGSTEVGLDHADRLNSFTESCSRFCDDLRIVGGGLK